MANVSIKFNGKEFLLSCDDGQEEHLEELLIQINQKFNDLKNNLGNLGENKLLLITAVKVMDEYYETKKKVEQKKSELKELSDKFKELKSLIYDYRDKKENEILDLKDEHKILKNEIDTNKKNFEKLKNLNFVNPKLKEHTDYLHNKKNQLEIEKQQLEEKYRTLLSDYDELKQKIKDQNQSQKNRELKFNEKIDELNQETDILIEEIDKWQI